MVPPLRRALWPILAAGPCGQLSSAGGTKPNQHHHPATRSPHIKSTRPWLRQRDHFTLVETGNGLFYGYYDEHAALAESDLTWIDATRDKSARFTLVKKKSTKLKSGDGLFKLFDASTHRVLGADFKELSQLKISSRHFRAMLERGVEGATQDRIIPTGDGVIFPDLGVETASTAALDKVIITDQIEARLKDVVPHAYIFDLETKQRVIEVRKVNSGWGQEMQESRPQRRKKNDVVEVSPDLDGCLRLTDGKRVYELKPFLGGTELLIWEAERNSLKRF